MSERSNYYADRAAYQDAYQNAVAQATGASRATESEYNKSLREYQEKKEAGDETYEQLRSAIESVGTPLLEEGLKGVVKNIKGRFEDKIASVSKDLIKKYGVEGGRQRFEAGLKALKEKGIDLKENVERRAKQSFEKARSGFRDLLPDKAPRPNLSNPEFSEADADLLRQRGILSRVQKVQGAGEDILGQYRNDPLYSSKTDSQLADDATRTQSVVDNLEEQRKGIQSFVRDNQRVLDTEDPNSMAHQTARGKAQELRDALDDNTSRLSSAREDAQTAKNILGRRNAVNALSEASGIEGKSVRAPPIERALGDLERPSLRVSPTDIPFSSQGESGILKDLQSVNRLRPTSELLSEGATRPTLLQRLAQEQQQREAEEQASQRAEGTPQQKAPETEANRNIGESMGEGAPPENPAQARTSPEDAQPAENAPSPETEKPVLEPNPEKSLSADDIEAGAKAVAKRGAGEATELLTEDAVLGGPEDPIGDVITGVTGLAMLLGGIFGKQHDDAPPPPPPKPPMINPAVGLGL